LSIIESGNNRADGFNRALDAVCSIGSFVKPAIYITALSTPEKYNLLSRIRGNPISIEEEDGLQRQPENYDCKVHGEVPLLEALKNSYNLATIQLGLNIDLQGAISTLQRSGIEQEIHAFPSLLLSAIELMSFDVAQMCQSIANGGFLVSLNSVIEVLYSNGNLYSTMVWR